MSGETPVRLTLVESFAVLSLGCAGRVVVEAANVGQAGEIVSLPSVSAGREGGPWALDDELLPRDKQLRPGESVRLPLKVVPARPGDFNLSDGSLVVQFGKPGAAAAIDLVPLPSMKFAVRADYAGQIALECKPLYALDEGQRVQWTLANRSPVALADFRLALEPAGAVLAGKTAICAGNLAPGEELTWDCVLTADAKASLAGQMGGEAVGWTRNFSLPRLAPEPEATFKFLEPRGMARVDVAVTRPDGSAVSQNGNEFPLQDGSIYLVKIQPLGEPDADVVVEGIANCIHVNRKERKPDGLVFTVEVAHKASFRDHKQLTYYIVPPAESGRNESVGSLKIGLVPSVNAKLSLAAKLGFAVSAQGLVGLFSMLAQLDSEGMEAFGLLLAQPGSLRNLTMSLAVPGAWFVLAVADQLWYHATAD